MALVPVANPADVAAVTESPATSRANDYQRIDVNADNFGGQIFKALQGAGAEVQGAGAGLEKQALANAELNNETNARNASTKAMGDIATKAADFFTKKGQNAVDAYPQFMADLQATNQATVGSMTNPSAQNMLGNAMAPIMRHYTEAAANHLKSETLSSNILSSTSRVNALADQAAMFRNDPDKVHTYIDGIAGEMQNLGQIQGWDADTLADKTRKAQGAAYTKVIEGLAVDNPLGAQRLFGQVRDGLDAGDALKISEFLKAKVDKADSESWLAGQVNATPSLPSNVNPDKLWDATEYHESHHLQFDPKTGQTLTSSKGAMGVSQIMPGTALTQGKALGVQLDTPEQQAAFMDRVKNDESYNRTLGRAYQTQMLQKYQDPTLALAAYSAGPGNVDKWLKTIGDPRTGAISTADFIAKIPFDETRNYVQDITNRVGADLNTGTLTKPDRQTLMQSAIASSPDLETQMRRASIATRYVDLFEHRDAQAHADLVHDITNNIEPALHAGIDGVTIPEQRIRSILKPEEAERVIGNLKYVQMSGQLFKTVAMATPEQVDDLRQDLVTGQGMMSNMLKGKGALLAGTPGAPIDAASPAGQQADFKLRQQMAQELETRIQQRREALRTDPAAYVASNDPVTNGAMQAAVKSTDPAVWQQYATTTLASQARLGVPEGRQQLLPMNYIDTLASKFKNDDPSKADPGVAIQGMAQQFGQFWPKVYGELVTKGKMPDEAAITAVLDAPGQAQVRQDYVRAWQAVAKDGEGKLEGLLDPGVKTDIEKNLAAKLQDFRSTVLVPGVSSAQNQDTYMQFAHGVKTLATYYALNGNANGSDAVQKAVDGMISLKWDLGSTYRTPKGMISQSETAMSQAERGLTVANVRDPGAVPGSKEAALDPDKRTELWLGGKKLWVNNEAGDGVVMRVQGRDGSVNPIYTKDGQRVELKFSDIAKSPVPALSAPPLGGAAAVP